MPIFLRTLIVLLAAPFLAAAAQNPLRRPFDAVETRFSNAHPVVHYTLRVPWADSAFFDVEMRVRNVADTFSIAMVAHPEYDDRYWRFVENLRVDDPRGIVVRVDSVRWRVTAPARMTTVRYRIRPGLPEDSFRAAWKAYLTPTGGLVGGPHTFMYILGAELAPSHVSLDLPPSWQSATGLSPTSDPRTYFAASTFVLTDSPIFVGRFHDWRFAVDGVPHRVVYWPVANAIAFDTTRFVGQLRGLAEQAIALFGRAPYRDYTFLFQDGAGGGLEHLNSLTIGAPSELLARDPRELMLETAHEFVHTWNLMRIRPAERRGVSHLPAPPTKGLWFSEGLTLFYADLLLRRAGVATEAATRLAHLEGLLARYFNSPGNARISPERVSEVAYGAAPGAGCPPAIPGGGCNYSASSHLQGELLGAMLDLLIRDATASRRSMDDVMRLMLQRFSGDSGFTTAGVERTVEDVCGCSTGVFFDRFVRAGNAIEFNQYLRFAGLRMVLTQVPALNRDSSPAPDLRVSVWVPQGEAAARILITNPASAWARAGLHTGDRLVSVDGQPVTAWPAFRQKLVGLRVGQQVRVEVLRPAGRFVATVYITGFDRPSVRIEELPNATSRQREVRRRWVESASPSG